MIKNIIFDVDNTIFDSSESNAIYYKEALKKLGYNPDKYLYLYHSLDAYESKFDENNNLYIKEDLIKEINETLNENYSTKLIDEMNNVVSKYWTKKLLSEDILKYLYNKYNIYAFSNWFYDGQYNRLKNVGYTKYITKVFTADVYGSKPFASAYKKILKEMNSKPDECVMIGDSLETDVIGANNIGMHAILFDCNRKYSKADLNGIECKNINNFEEIKKIF